MFVKAFLTGCRNMVESKTDLDRLRFMPQKIEDGKLVNFNGATLLGGLDIKDMEIFDADRVNDTKRFTAALSRDYFLAFDKVMPLFSNGAETSNDSNAVYGADIFDAVAKDDKKALRALLKEYKNNKWSALNEDDVEDAIDDIKDCAADKDVDGAKEIVADLIGEDICEVETKEPTKSVSHKEVEALINKPTESTNKPANEDEAELLADLEDALADEDYEDVELLLKELGEGHPRYAEFEAKLPSNSKEEAKPEASSEDDNIIAEICEDIDAALEDGDVKDAKSILEELADEAGKDSDVYKEYEAKVNPPKERTRRPRRERG